MKAHNLKFNTQPGLSGQTLPQIGRKKNALITKKMFEKPLMTINKECAMRTLQYNECNIVSGGTDYAIWAQVGAGLGTMGGMLYTLSGPMTGAALVFKPFEMVLKAIVGAGIGLGAGFVAAVLYETAYTIYEASKQGAELGVQLAPLLLL